jgi:hypothetical protein
MALEDEILYRIVFPVIATCLGGLVVYMARKYNGLVAMIEKQNRTLYGDDNSEWIGLSKLVQQLKKLEEHDRRALIALVSILARTNTIVPDKELDVAFSKVRDE